MTDYAHGTTDLLGIQIDAAINDGNSGIIFTHSTKAAAVQCSASKASIFFAFFMLVHAKRMALCNYPPLQGCLFSLTSSICSGGPAFNLAGEVVGVAFQSLSGGDNIGYLIPCDIVHHFLKQYRQVVLLLLLIAACPCCSVPSLARSLADFVL